MNTTCANTKPMATTHVGNTFSETLRSMQITATLLLNENYLAPWAIEIPNKDELALSFQQEKNIHMAAFHLVTRGYIEIELEDGTKELVREGEMVICYTGMAHTLYQVSKGKTRQFTEIIQSGQNIFQPDKENLAQSTSLICGVFILHHTIFNPLFDSLPALVKITSRPTNVDADSSIAELIKLLLIEMEQPSFTHSFSVERYLELLCAKSIQSHIETGSKVKSGWLRAIKDPVITQVISAIHMRPAKEWSVKEMAKIISLSPSRFAARFTEIMGSTPMAYVIQWRMYLASKQLIETNLSLEQIASQLGYENITTFSRSFKRCFETAPGIWRKNNQ